MMNPVKPFRVRVFRNSACETHFIATAEHSTDRIVYGELIAAAKVTWKRGGPAMFLERLAAMDAKQQRRDMGEQ